MKSKQRFESISRISDDELLRRLRELLQQSRRVEAELVAHIGEVDQRRLYARYASSMFGYCTKVLHLSEHEAYLRIEVARASRRHPALLELLADGRLHLSGIAKLAPHLTAANRDAVLARAAHQTKRHIEELVAELSPRPDVPTTIRKLPERREAKLKRTKLGPDRVPLHCEPEPTDREAAFERLSVPVPARPAVVKPIAPARYEVRFTASAELRDKLERLRSLMRTSVPDGDLAALIEVAVTEMLERLESKRFGKTKAPRKALEETDLSRSSRYIPAAVKRAVCQRDRNQCTFEDETGRRCTETERLEFHHLEPFGRGGGHSPDNVVLMCETHNAYVAERDYGKEVMARYRRSSSRVSEPSPVYYLESRAPIPSTILASEMSTASTPVKGPTHPTCYGRLLAMKQGSTLDIARSRTHAKMTISGGSRLHRKARMSSTAVRGLISEGRKGKAILLSSGIAPGDGRSASC